MRDNAGRCIEQALGARQTDHSCTVWLRVLLDGREIPSSHRSMGRNHLASIASGVAQIEIDVTEHTAEVGVVESDHARESVKKWQHVTMKFRVAEFIEDGIVV